MKQILHLRGDPYPGVTVAHSGHVHVTIPEFRRIDSLPRRSHDIVIEQAFRHRIREAGVKNPLLQGKVASSGDAEAACTQSTKEKPTIHRSCGFMGRRVDEAAEKNRDNEAVGLAVHCKESEEQVVQDHGWSINNWPLKQPLMGTPQWS